MIGAVLGTKTRVIWQTSARKSEQYQTATRGRAKQRTEISQRANSKQNKKDQSNSRLGVQIWAARQTAMI